MLEFSEYTKMLIGLIAILNPIGAIPIFISLTCELDRSERSAVSKVVCVCRIHYLAIISIYRGMGFNFFWNNNQFISCCRRITYSVDGDLHDACEN